MELRAQNVVLPCRRFEETLAFYRNTLGLEAFREAGVPILREWSDHNGDFLLVADPEGNLLQIYRQCGPR